MKILVTHPGKLGDLVWALPTVRWLAETYKCPVDLWLERELAPLKEVLEAQGYIGKVFVDPDWVTVEGAPRTPIVPPGLTDAIGTRWDEGFNLGYTEWPREPLPYEAARLLRQQLPVDWHAPAIHLDLDDSWISWPKRHNTTREDYPIVLVHWADRWIELKVGLTHMLMQRLYPSAAAGDVAFMLCGPPDSRWVDETGGLSGNAWVKPYTLPELLPLLKSAAVVLTDSSAVMTLAVGMGKPTICVEPEPARHHPVFWPDLLNLIPVYGNDGKMTFDARHTADVLRGAVRRVGAEIAANRARRPASYAKHEEDQ